MASLEKNKIKEKNQNIQVFVRLRPLNQRERSIRSLSVVEVVNSREVVVRQSQQTSHTKRFTFDRAFGPAAEQVEVYKEVVSPLIAEVLAGYNCTVFAYGQTGTGKTHTMVGESSGEGCTWQNDPLAGMIPRALSHLFDELRISKMEYNVRVSYLELYNEELFDLLSSSIDNSKLRIYEDVTRKGSTIVNGLEEITVYNKNEVYDIMARGQERKRVASTLMNSQSSRSHTVFTIVVHIKENSQKGEELVKIGKLNLVDLAGSENISKAGSDNPAKKERARECVNINQSLLTLGRVITALVEKHPHIPYRESKLTRILQESLGGRTKTSIIATISPGHKDLEETMSTLEYANRAKNIQNKPEVNQKLTKQAILKEFAEEVDKLKRELIATREKNGVYLPTETYEEMTIKDEEQRREIQELLLKKRAMEDERERMEAVFQQLEEQHSRAQDSLANTREQLDATAAQLAITEQERAEKQCLLERHVQTESQLIQQAEQLIAVADGASGDVASLHDTVDRRRNVESANQQTVAAYRDQATAQRQGMLSEVHTLTDSFTAAREQLQTSIDDQARDTSMTQEMNIQDMKLLLAKLSMYGNEISSQTSETLNELKSSTAESQSQLAESAQGRLEALHLAFSALLKKFNANVDRVAATDVTGTVQRSTDQWLNGATARVDCLHRTQSSHSGHARSMESSREETLRRYHAECLSRLRAREDASNACIQQMERDKKATQERLSQLLATIESERLEKERMLETMLREIENLRAAINTSAEKRKAQIEELKHTYEATTEEYLLQQRRHLDTIRQETEIENEYLEKCEQDTLLRLKNIDDFDKEFGEGASAITAEMEAFSHSVVHIVGHTSDQLLGELSAARTDIEKSTHEALESAAASTQEYLQTTNAAVEGVAQKAAVALNAAALKTEEVSTSATESLQAVSERSSRLAQSALWQQSAQTLALAQATDAVHAAGARLRERLDAQAQAEGRYLLQDYRVYAPSGNTPARREFRYPRRLAATSPHDRILARFRAQQRDVQRNNHDSDCLVVESDIEYRHSSDSEVSESEMSGDSAVAMQ